MHWWRWKTRNVFLLLSNFGQNKLILNRLICQGSVKKIAWFLYFNSLFWYNFDKNKKIMLAAFVSIIVIAAKIFMIEICCGHINLYLLVLTCGLLIDYNLCKQFGPRSGLTKCQSWSGSKLFDNLKGIFERNFQTKVNFDHGSTLAAPDLAKTFGIPKMSIKIDCTVPNLMPTSLAMLCKSHLLSHITRVCTTLTFSSAMASLGRPDRPSSSTFSLPPLKLCAHFFTVLRRSSDKAYIFPSWHDYKTLIFKLP